MEDALAAFGLVFAAELGDKSMLLAIAFAARMPARIALAGIALAAVVSTGLAALVGAAVGVALPDRAVTVAAGVLFVGFGLWALRDDDEEEAADRRASRSLLGVMLAFLVAEIGDKTAVATAALAGTRGALPTWLGASLGMTAASGIAILVASALGARLPERLVRLVAAVAFLAFGVLLVLDGLRG